MEYLFEIVDKTGRKIHLTKERASHIIEHPEMTNQIENIKNTLINPLKITRYIFEEDIFYYYKYFKYIESPAKYLLVIVKYLNGIGFIITSYFVKNIK